MMFCSKSVRHLAMSPFKKMSGLIDEGENQEQADLLGSLTPSEIIKVYQDSMEDIKLRKYETFKDLAIVNLLKWRIDQPGATMVTFLTIKK